MRRDFSRQGFLGPQSEAILHHVKVGVVGYGGGGSHVGQQLAHIGIGCVVVCDGDRIDNSNLNRLVGGRWSDIQRRTRKVTIADRLYRSVNPAGHIRTVRKRWQAAHSELVGCDVIFGCLDTYIERDQLETFCRRFLIPYIDIGMSVHRVDRHYGISGQVILSMPGGPCMRCLNFITDAQLKKEAARYGAAGWRPQVVWPNGVLASTAVGILMQLITPWHSDHRKGAYYTYNGNTGTVSESHRLEFALKKKCRHFRAADLGDPFFRLRKFAA